MYLTDIWDYPQKMWPIFRDLWVIPHAKVLDIWLAFNPHRVATLCSSFSRENWSSQQMDVSKNKGIPKWMVYIMENPIKMDDLGIPLFLQTPKSFAHQDTQQTPDTSDADSQKTPHLFQQYS